MKVVLITGCSSGIGHHCANALKNRGYLVFATARKQEDVRALQEEGLQSVRLDLLDSESIHKAVSYVMKKAGRIDVLFNNAGYGQPGACEDLPRDALRDQFETNLFGPVELTNAIIPIMRRQNSGRIIWNSSVLGLVAMPYRGAYNATKFAMEGFVDTMRLELKGTGIYTVLIEPGPIRSEFRKNAFIQFKENIDPQASVHDLSYGRLAKKLRKKEATAFFTMGPEAVLRKLLRAIESRKPRARYYVTFPAYFIAALKRVAPQCLLDSLLRKW